jgi:hypothetical protein
MRGPAPHLILAGSLLLAIALTAVNEPPFSWRSVAANASLKFLELVLVGALLWMSWQIVGGRASAANFITAYSYLFAAWMLTFSLLTAIDEVALRLLEPKLFAAITVVAPPGQAQDTRKVRVLLGPECTYALKAVVDSDEEFNDAIAAPGFLWIASAAALRGAFTLLWLLVSWGVFRKILGLSWPRSVFALAIFLGFGLIVILAVVFVQMAPIVLDPHRWLDKWLRA